MLSREAILEFYDHSHDIVKAVFYENPFGSSMQDKGIGKAIKKTSQKMLT